mgnify:CR=1 FL=1
MAGSDVRAIRLTATGSAGVGPARIRQVQVKTTTGSPRITFTNGNGGATVIEKLFTNGIRVSDIYVSVFTACTSVTVFHS